MELLWKNFIPYKRALHCWKLTHNRLPTDENLEKRGINTASRCRLCEADAESTDHIFIHCSFSNDLWTTLSSWFSNHIDLLKDFEHLFCKALKDDLSPQIKSLWLAGITVTCWEIWRTRNRRVFDD